MGNKTAELLATTAPFEQKGQGERQVEHGRPRLLQTRHLCTHYNVCDRTIDRWLLDPRVNFPQPVRIQRRRYWREDDIDRFDERQRRATAVEPQQGADE